MNAALILVFVAAFQADDVDIEQSFANARALYSAGRVDVALPRLRAIALSSGKLDAQAAKRCEHAANLVMDAYASTEAYEELNSFARAYRASACWRAHHPLYQAKLRPQARPEAALDDLAFIDGCWTSWSVD